MVDELSFVADGLEKVGIGVDEGEGGRSRLISKLLVFGSVCLLKLC